MNDPDRIAYFDALNAEADNGGIAAFLDYLMNYDLTGFTPFAAPDTAGLAEQKLKSLSDEELWMRGVLETGQFDDRDGETTTADWEMDEPFLIECSAVQASFNSHVRRYGGSSGGGAAVRMVLEGHGKVERKQKGGREQRSWHYILGTRREWRDRFVARYLIPFADDGA